MDLVESVIRLDLYVLRLNTWHPPYTAIFRSIRSSFCKRIVVMARVLQRLYVAASRTCTQSLSKHVLKSSSCANSAAHILNLSGSRCRLFSSSSCIACKYKFVLTLGVVVTSPLAYQVYVDAISDPSVRLLCWLIAVSDGLNEEQQQILQMATDFAKNEMEPKMKEWDEEVRQRSQ